jgi:hypothetical protein
MLSEATVGAILTVSVLVIFFIWMWSQRGEREPCSRCPSERQERLISITTARD